MQNIDQIQLGFTQENGEEKFLFFDTETTCLAKKDLVQLAFLTSDGKELNMFFKPKNEISCGSMAIHNITPEMVKDKPSFEDAELEGEKVKDYLEKLTKEYIWVAHNAEFDKEVLEQKGLEIPRTVCTFKLARELLSKDQKDEYDLESYSLQFLRYYLGLYRNENTQNNVAHDALSDVHFLKDLFEYFQKNFNLTTEKMLNISKAPLIMRNLHHGKHAGKSIKEIQQEDPSYLQWIIETWEDKPDVVWNIKRIIDL